MTLGELWTHIKTVPDNFSYRLPTRDEYRELRTADAVRDFIVTYRNWPVIDWTVRVTEQYGYEMRVRL